jgi:multidrug resistance protein
MQNSTALKPSFLILMMLISYPSFVAVFYTPALPNMATYFNVSRGFIQQSMTAYLFGYAIGQLFYGPVANAFGRKKALYLGAIISIVGSLGCALARPFVSIWMLFIFRFIQAFGASCGINMTFTYIYDCFDEKEARKVSSIMPISFAIMPVIGILLGGFITHFLDWEWCFYVLTIFGLLLVMLITKLPEPNHPNDHLAIYPLHVVRSYIAAIKNMKMVLFSLLLGCGVSLYYIFSTIAPFIVIVDLKETISTFGEISLVLGLGYLFGSIFSRVLVKYVSTRKALVIGISVDTFFALLMLVCFLMGKVNLFTLFFPMTMIFFGQSLVFASATQLGMVHSVDHASTSSMMSFIFIGFSVLSVLIISASYTKKAVELPIYLLLFIAIMWLFYYLALKRLKKLGPY